MRELPTIIKNTAVIVVFFSLTATSVKAVVENQSERPPTPKEIENYIAGFVASDKYDDEAGAYLLQNIPLTKEQFMAVVKKGNGGGVKTNGALGRLAASPTTLLGNYDTIAEAVKYYPDLEPAKYLAGNRYLEAKQFEDLFQFSKENPDSLLAEELARNAALPKSLLSVAIKMGVEDPRSAIGAGVARRGDLTGAEYEMLAKRAVVAPDSKLARAIGNNAAIPAKTLSLLVEAAKGNPDSFLAKGAAGNPQLNAGELKDLTKVAMALPDSKMAEGIGGNTGLTSEICDSLSGVAEKPDSKLAVALGKNKVINDNLFNAFIKSAKKMPGTGLAAALAGAGGSAASDERISRVAKIATENPDTELAYLIALNPNVPAGDVDSLVTAALDTFGSKMSKGYLQSIKEQRFPGSQDQRGKFLELSLTSTAKQKDLEQ